MRGGLWALTLSLACAAQPVPESIRVKVLVHPAGARFLCGIQLQKGSQERTPASLRVKVPHLEADGLVDLLLGSDYSELTDNIPVGVDAPGYAPFLTNVTRSQLTGDPALLWPETVHLQPVSWQAHLQENPALLLGPLLGLAVLAAIANHLRGRRPPKLAPKFSGQVIDGLRILGELGAGGMATVYRVEPVDQPGQLLALKLLHPGSKDPKFVERFRREVNVCSRLSHPRLMLLHRSLDCNGQLGLLMELVAGTTLRDKIPAAGFLPLATVVEWMGAICQGLFYAHSQGVVHRDLKPDNIMITPQGQIKIMDFGIARPTDGTQLSESNSVIGTVAYMAPEQISAGAVTPALDQYALGIMLYELLTGRVPFESANPFDIFRMHLEAPRPSLQKVRPELPRAVDDVMQKMLAICPEDRFGDVERAMRTLRFAAN